MEALADLPEGTVVDGEVVAMDDSGRPNFNLLQNFRAEASRIQYYVFDLLCWEDRDLTRPPLIERRMLLKALLVVNDKRIRITDYVGRRQPTCSLPSASKVSKESSRNKRTATTNRVNEAAPGLSIA